MNLVKVTGSPFTITCASCGKTGYSDEGQWYADTEGTPYKAYYCFACGSAALIRAGHTTTGVVLTKHQALKLLDWHGGQGSALYALGSSSYAGFGQPGHPVTIELAENAIRELREVLSEVGSKSKLTAADKKDLQQRIKDVEAAIRKANKQSSKASAKYSVRPKAAKKHSRSSVTGIGGVR